MQLTRALILVEMAATALFLTHADARYAKELNTITDIYSAIRVCWKAPHIPGPAELTVRLSFTRDGKILGKARVTFENKMSSVANVLLYRMAVVEAFKLCTPFPFSPDLGDAIAGRPLIFRFRGNSGSAI